MYYEIICSEADNPPTQTYHATNDTELEKILTPALFALACTMQPGDTATVTYASVLVHWEIKRHS